MSSISSQELAASLSASKEPGCEPSRSVRSIQNAAKSSPSIGQASPAIPTSEPLPGPTLPQMELDLSTLSAEASPARTSASQERALALRASVPAYGRTTPELL